MWRQEEGQSEGTLLPSTPQDEKGGDLDVVRGDNENEEDMMRLVEETGPKAEDEFIRDVYSSTVTVTIDVPRDGDHGDEDDPVTRYLSGGATPKVQSDRSGGEDMQWCDGAGENGRDEECSGGGLYELFGGAGGELQSEEEYNMYESLNEADVSEEEDCDTPPIRLCLLSR